jgi:hypothetical protein
MSSKNTKKGNSSLKKKKYVTSLVIGDPHFKHTNLDEMREFSNKTIEIAENLKPTFIVILGDTLDTHEIIRIEPRDAAEEWIEKLTEISEVFLLIGNHDMANPNEFLTKKHAFTTLKRWSSVQKGKLHIVDEPTCKEFQDKTFVLCPYVPPGRFGEALDELCKQGVTWDLADCIFAHQQFKGGHQGAYEITDGDEWDEDYPHVINGHFHNEELIGKNIHIVGTPIQHSYGDSPDKKIWFLTFDDENDDLPFSIEKIDLGIKTKKTLIFNIDDVHNFKSDLTKKYYIKLKIKGEPEQIQIFKTTELYKKLLNMKDLKITFEKNENAILNEVDLEKLKLEKSSFRDEVSYLGVLQKIVEKKPDSVKEMYNEIVGKVEEEVVYDIVFESDEDIEEIEDDKSEDIEESEDVELEGKSEDIEDVEESEYEEVEDESDDLEEVEESEDEDLEEVEDESKESEELEDIEDESEELEDIEDESEDSNTGNCSEESENSE